MMCHLMELNIWNFGATLRPPFKKIVHHFGIHQKVHFFIFFLEPLSLVFFKGIITILSTPVGYTSKNIPKTFTTNWW